MWKVGTRNPLYTPLYIRVEQPDIHLEEEEEEGQEEMDVEGQCWATGLKYRLYPVYAKFFGVAERCDNCVCVILCNISHSQWKIPVFSH